MASADPPPHTPGVPVPGASPNAAAPAAAAVVTGVSSSATTLPAAGAVFLRRRTPSEIYAPRLLFAVGRINSFFKSGCRGDPSSLVQPYYVVARCIDFSVINGEVFTSAYALPQLVKQIYKFRNEPSLQSVIMVLLISVKNACQKGWFPVAERNELIAMANEMSNKYCCGGVISEESKASSIISMIVTRFYPLMKLRSVLVSLEAKPGYDTLVSGFMVLGNMLLHEKIRLFVAQTDNMETSSCLISPPEVTFLINGKGVERRTAGYVDAGPQFPRDITKMLKCGTNLIQAIGSFGGNYIVAVASMSTKAPSGIPILQDYEQPVVATIAQDAEIIEGPSKISLNCPISFRRIKTPVKGHHCKHHQCFDYENFMAMNARKPSWRCPHCNQSVSCVDIRIDQNMVKILCETGENVTHVVVFADGSWKVVEHDGSADKPHGMLTGDRDDGIECEPNGLSDSSFHIVDLTMEEDNQVDVAANVRHIEFLNGLPNQSGSTCDAVETKPFQDIFEGLSVSELICAAQPATFNSEAIPLTHGQVSDDLQSRISLATTTSVVAGNVSQPYSPTVGIGHTQIPSLDPIITDAVSPALNREDADNFVLPTSAIQSSTQTQQFMDNLQLQQAHFGNSVIANEPERQPIPRHVNRTPIAIQALPAQPQLPSFGQRPQATSLSLTSLPSISVQVSPSVLVNQDEINSANTGTGRQQFSRIHNLASTQFHSVIQNQDRQSSQYMLNPVTEHVMGFPAQNPASTSSLPNQQRGAVSFGMQASTVGQSPQQRHPNMWTQQTVSQATSVAPQPSRFSSVPVQHAAQGAVNMVGGVSVNHNPVMVAQQLAQPVMHHVMQASRSPSFQATGDNFRISSGEQVRGVGGGTTPEALASNGFGDAAAEPSWRPTGRMRGSLTGSAYAAALGLYMLQPSQSAMSSGPTAAADPSLAVAPEQHTLLPNGTNAGGSLAEQSSPRNEDPGGPLRV